MNVCVTVCTYVYKNRHIDSDSDNDNKANSAAAAAAAKQSLSDIAGISEWNKLYLTWYLASNIWNALDIYFDQFFMAFQFCL